MTFEEVRMHFDILLIEHDAYEAFYKNVDEDWEDCVSTWGFSFMLMQAFEWTESPEGSDYWRKLSELWESVWEKLSE